jgi:hypothetical protein
MPKVPRRRAGHRQGAGFVDIARQRAYNAAEIQRKAKYRNVGLRIHTQGTSTRTTHYN